MRSAIADDFQGTERFSIESRLGAGGFGVVYRAYDRKRKSVVALKALRRAESDSLYRFKQEFRSLADISHRNLVALYELLSEEDQWFFTMELVEGVNILEYVRGGRSCDGAVSGDGTEAFPTESGAAPPEIARDPASNLLRLGLAEPSGPETAAAAPFDPSRLRAVLRQLGEGLQALHEAGKLHRDIKPSNVLVDRSGRVVLLDFGLVSDLGPEGFLHSIHLVGTPAYMSPEQAAGRPVTEASDWYGVGVMLYEALTGTRPFPGEFLDVLVEKQRSEPVPPRSLVPSVPDDLDALCRALLRRDPLERPCGEEILDVLRALAPEPLETRAAVAPRAAPFVGREAQLAELSDAFEKTKAGKAVAVLVRGSSGVGKTALVRRFLEGVNRDEVGAVVLTGRCYEQETVPYKALDSLVDALSQYLRRLPQPEAEALLPRDLLALSRLFPVLRQVEAVALARRRVAAIPDSLEQRRRGFGALRELFARLAERKAVVLFIDDLQWGDADSAALLIELLRPPDSPPLLWIGCYRTEDVSRSPLLGPLLAYRPAPAADLEIRELEVAELSPEEARELARSLLEGDGAAGRASAESVASESGGNPFLLDELARHVRSGEPLQQHGAAHLEDVIHARISHLPEDARRLLDVLAVAGRPVSRAIARRAAGLEGDEQAALAVLRAGHLVRGTSAESGEQIEIYHDRIGETVVSFIPLETLAVIHERLALALEISGEADPESLAVHYQHAGALERASVYAADAAAKAVEALAFDRAARLYKMALELGTRDAVARQSLRVKLGDALANAGRGAEAARAYLAAAEGSGATENLELQRRAAEQLLASGHVDEGLAVTRRVLDRIGMRLAATPWRAVLSLLFHRLQLRLRGFEFRERSATEIPPDELIRIDTCWSVSTALSMSSTVRARDFQTRHLLLALKAGEPYRVARAMGVEAAFAGLGGSRARRRTERLVARAMALAERVNRPHAVAIAYIGAGMSAHLEGRWEAGWENARRCEQILREQCTGVAWEFDSVHVYSLRSLFFLGRLRELSEQLPKLLREAEERDDLYLATSLRTRHAYVVHLMGDEPEKARRRLRRAAERWSHEDFYLQHYFRLIGDLEISLYEGSAQAAWAALGAHWRELERSLLLRTGQFLRIESRHLRARCALASAEGENLLPSNRQRLLRSAARDARRIRREGTHWGDPLARLLQAGIIAHRGEREEALARLASAEAGFEAAKMSLYAAAARRCRGLLLGSEEGRALVESADSWMRKERIQNPERMTAMLAPGRWKDDSARDGHRGD